MQRFFLTLMVALALPLQAAREASTDEDAERDLARSLKDDLILSATGAIQHLGRQDGFLQNQKAHIPLPETLSRAASGLRRFGMSRYPEELEVTINRAAEAAVPELRNLLVESIERLTFDDPKALAEAGAQASVLYVRNRTQTVMATRFLPIVQATTRRLRVAESYNQVAGRASKVGLLRSDDANLDEYISRKALEAVYSAMIDEQRVLRVAPTKRGSRVVRSASGTR